MKQQWIQFENHGEAFWKCFFELICVDKQLWNSMISRVQGMSTFLEIVF